MVKLVNTRDLKSLGFGFAGSSPAARTNTLWPLENRSGAPDAMMIEQLVHQHIRQLEGLFGIGARDGPVVCKKCGAMNGRDPNTLPRTEYRLG